MKELKKKLDSIVSIYNNAKEAITTEEATKNALVMPMLQALGYNVFNPMEVIPEFTADLGIKKGEKVDYALMEAGKPVILVECKHWKEDLDNHVSQMHRYFGVTSAKFGILTNGIEYRVYSDLDDKNIMDTVPFLTFSIYTEEENLFNVKELHKGVFDSKDMVAKAKILKNNSVISEAVYTEFNNPSEEFIRLLIKSGFGSSKRISDKVLTEFKPIIRQAINSLISAKVTTKLTKALVETEEKPDNTKVPTIFTTEEESEGFQIIKAMVRKVLPVDRVVAKDTKSYFGILVDNNVRRPICRLYFNTDTKYIAIFGDNKVEVKHKIESLNDLYNFETVLLDTARIYI